MPFVAVGVTQDEIGSDAFDNFALDDDAASELGKRISALESVDEVVVVNTCARSEVFAVVEQFHSGVEQIIEAISESLNIPKEVVTDVSRVYYDQGSIRHLFSLTSGIESKIVGESEIIGQVRRGFFRAKEKYQAKGRLERVFQKSFEVGKRVRSETTISQGTTSSAYAAIDLALTRIGSVESALVIGLGELGSKVACGLIDKGITTYVSNRDDSKAKSFVAKEDGLAVSFGEWQAILSKVDCAFFVTSSPDPLMNGAVAASLSVGRGQSPLIVDLGVPRNVGSEVKSLEGLLVIDMDDVYAYLDDEMEKRRGQVYFARVIIDEEVSKFYNNDAVNEVVKPTVSALYKMAEEIKVAELERFRSKLAALDDDEAKLVEQVLSGAVAKMLHAPVTKLKAASKDRSERLIDAITYLFDID
ncbi:MAG: glutamyl-tRNA reductase [Actinomycetota bacterium]|jgi:glutamyl-tRNA reductase|nr:glutamyl-tRNA reductase [Actinomycetota bacterium]